MVFSTPKTILLLIPGVGAHDSHHMGLLGFDTWRDLTLVLRLIITSLSIDLLPGTRIAQVL